MVIVVYSISICFYFAFKTPRDKLPRIRTVQTSTSTNLVILSRSDTDLFISILGWLPTTKTSTPLIAK